MTTRTRTLATCAAFALASTTVQAIDVLYIANGNDASYQALIEGKYPDSNWVQKAVGVDAGSDTIGGDLDLTNRAFTGIHAVPGMSQKAYIQSFDLVIVDNPTTSSRFTDGALGADWANISKPILFNSAFAARALDGRVGLFAGGGTGTPALASPAESVRLAFTPLSDAIFENVTDVTNLYASTSTDSINALQSAGQGQLISSISGTDPAIPAVTSYHGIAFWNAGDQIAVNHTLAAKRAYMPLKGIVGDEFANGDLTDDGRTALGNLIDELLVESEVIFLPPTNLVAKSAADLKINLTWTATDGAVSYKIKRSTTPGGPYTELITNPATVTTTNYQDSGLTEGNTYYYVVSAVNAAAAESPDSAPASAPAVATLLAGIDILYVATANNADYQNLLTNGQFANNTWTFKAPGTAGDNLVGGDISREAEFSGTNGTEPGVPVAVNQYLNRFGLVIVGVPTGSSNFIDTANGGALWADLTVPIMVHSPFVARALGGRLGLFSGDNAVNPAVFVSATESVRTSVSPLSDAILAGVTDITNLYATAQVDTINTAVRSPNDLGQGEEITRIGATIGADPTPVQVRGVVFWATGATLPVSPPLGLQVASNRAFLPLTGGPADLNADGRTVLTNLIKELQVNQNITFPPLLTYPAGVAAQEVAGEVYISWEQAINADSYNVKRSTNAGGPYTEIATNVINLDYTDATDITPGATYYYVISAVSGNPPESPNSDEVSVTLSSGDNFDAWIQNYLAQIPNEADRLPGADPDKDGITNLVEFAINGNPADPSDSGAIASLIQNSSLTLIVAVRDGADFAGGATAMVSGITYTVEGSLGLSFPDSAVSSTGPTDTAPAEAGLPDLSGDWEYHTFTLDASTGLTGKGFLRLKVTQPDVP